MNNDKFMKKACIMTFTRMFWWCYFESCSGCRWIWWDRKWYSWGEKQILSDLDVCPYRRPPINTNKSPRCRTPHTTAPVLWSITRTHATYITATPKAPFWLVKRCWLSFCSVWAALSVVCYRFYSNSLSTGTDRLKIWWCLCHLWNI